MEERDSVQGEVFDLNIEIGSTHCIVVHGECHLQVRTQAPHAGCQSQNMQQGRLSLSAAEAGIAESQIAFWKDVVML
jgi:hypothetical protein